MTPDEKVSNILFITSSRIGDAVLSFGILDNLLQRHPNAKFTIVCGPLVSSFFEGFPNLDEVISVKKKKYNKHWFDVWRKVVGKQFDIVVDLRNSIVSRTIRADRRYVMGPHISKNLHKVEQNARVMGLSDVPSPKLWFTPQQLSKAQVLIPDGGPVLGVGPTANWAGKTWPYERFIEIIHWMTSDSGFLEGARVAIFAAPGEEVNAKLVLNSISEEKRIDLIARTDPATAGACLARCTYYLGNDSGLMHCAAAAGIPTFGVFGPSYPQIYRPWGKNAAFAATPETFDQLIDFEGYDPKTVGCLMGSLTVDTVKEGITKNWPM